MHTDNQCHCNSKNLYKEDYFSDPLTQLKINQQKIDLRQRYQRHRDKNKISSLSKQDYLNNPIYKSAIQSSQYWLPTQIQKISWYQIQFNPIWFYQSFISKNLPCIITDTLQGDQICQRWSQQQYLTQVLQNYNQISTSLTPDGFADSIKGDYFVEPEEIKTGIKKFFQYEDEFQNTVPYIQHQNSSLTEEMFILNAEVDQENLKYLKKYLFNGKQPDAQNFWMGYDQSVSAMHKDPYENLYTVITGSKHFTLIPPIDIFHLQQHTYHRAKYSYNTQSKQFSLKQLQSPNTTSWISCNPDLFLDYQNKQSFPYLSLCHKYHIIVQKSEMLYLPSLWYHQVSQEKKKDQYTMAINYWFDMEFDQKYAMYEMCRKIKGL